MNDERRTPPGLFARLDTLFKFTVDAAATRENALVPTYWDKATDGLQQDWNGHTVWCNPPYSRGQLRLWIDKAIASALATTVMLIPADSSTGASQRALALGEVLFLNHRLAFDDEESAAKFANWIVLFHGTRRDRANLHLLNLGVVL